MSKEISHLIVATENIRLFPLKTNAYLKDCRSQVAKASKIHKNISGHHFQSLNHSGCFVLFCFPNITSLPQPIWAVRGDSCSRSCGKQNVPRKAGRGGRGRDGFQHSEPNNAIGRKKENK